MNATQTTPDPVLQRLHEVTARIRRRAAEGRARALAKAGRSVPTPETGQAELPLLPVRPVLRLEPPPAPAGWSRAA